jgi:hypothetical protein
MTETLTFDLSECSQRAYASTRGVRIAFVLIAGVLAATGVVGFVYQVVHGTLVTSFRLLFGFPYYVAFGFAIFLGWGSTKFAPGATRLTIGDEGVCWSFPDGSEQLLRWNDRRFRINIEDARKNTLVQKYGFDGAARIRNHPPTSLSSNALDALIATAREHHLAVTARERGGRWSFAGPLHEWIEIRPPERREFGAG